MTTYGGRRTQGERDAMTVEIGYALCSAAFAAAVLFGAVVGPVYVFGLPAGVRSTLVATGTVLAVVVFVARVVSVLVRFGRRDQPSQPGRTSPDS
ncbi:DUF6332 family protein [Streptomyces sp. NPDC087512]|uniref:DUF6332 family protein n=1 Tax=Streptomyces sp. NPDC087512 TaxID=3155059 RepID=UPI00343DF4F6